MVAAMSITTQSRADALVERLFAATIDGLELLSVYLGSELGLYRTLAERGPMTSASLSREAGIAPRYAREWLEQQALARPLDVAADRDAHHPPHPPRPQPP